MQTALAIDKQAIVKMFPPFFPNKFCIKDSVNFFFIRNVSLLKEMSLFIVSYKTKQD
jgi:hypothetical protein